MILFEQFLFGQAPKVFFSALRLACLLPQLVGAGRNGFIDSPIHGPSPAQLGAIGGVTNPVIPHKAACEPKKPLVQAVALFCRLCVALQLRTHCNSDKSDVDKLNPGSVV